MTAKQQEPIFELSEPRQEAESMTKRRIDTDPIIRTTVRLPQSLLNAAKHRGIDDGQALQEVIMRALEAYLKQKGGRQ